MINAKIQDGTGTNKRVKVNGDFALYVANIPYPPFEKQRIKPFRQFLTDDGLSTGTSDMSVDGSVTSQDFFIKAAAAARICR